MSNADAIIELKDYIRDVPDFPKPGIMFKDITTLIKHPDAFRASILQLADRYRDSGITKVVGIEARGFIFAAALAYEMGIGMVPVRKLGKLPAQCVQETYELEYGTDVVEMHSDALEKDELVLVLDDVIATGGTLLAACKLVEVLGANVAETAAVVELEFLEGRRRLEGRPFFSLIRYS
mgnify:CR=1 FL=1